MIVYEKSFPSALYKAQGPLKALYAKSLNGSMEEELFFSWFTFFVSKTQHFGKLYFIDTGRENYIILYCLPPHTTHILQPLHVPVYKPLKNHFNSITHFIILASLTLNEKVFKYKTNIHRQNDDNNNSGFRIKSKQIWFSSVWDLPFQSQCNYQGPSNAI